MAQIIRITSEALQATIRRLLPSQQGFGEDLQASNVIQPIIDLTPTAEGSVLREDLQTSLAFTDQTAFGLGTGTSTIISTAGFYRVIGNIALITTTSANREVAFSGTDGLSTKKLLVFPGLADPTVRNYVLPVDVVFFNETGNSVTVTCSTQCRAELSVRQIADVYGNIKTPTGFTFE